MTRNKKLAIRLIASITTALALAACGGGDESKEDLVVAYSYPSSATPNFLLQPLEIRPNVTGTNGHAARFTATNPLPTGLSLDPSNGAITGTPRLAGEYGALTNNPLTVMLTVDGYEGTLVSSVTFNIRNPFGLQYAFSRLIVNQPRTIVPTITGLQPGDVATFSLVPMAGNTGGTIPIGMTFDSATGVISGTPTVIATPQPGSVSHLFLVKLDVRRGDLVTYAATASSINFSVSPI